MSFSWPRLFGFSLPILALGSPIAITIPKQLFSEASSIHHYFFRVPFSTNELREKDKQLSEDSNRLAGYYKKYLNQQTHINKLSEFGTSKVEGSNQPNLFIQVQRKEEIKNREWEWLQTVKFNQITVDRWIEKSPNDKEIVGDSDLFKELIKVEHLLTENAKLTRNAINQDAIDIYFKTAHIDKEEIKKLVYVPTSQTNQNNWFVWLDKELLRLKLNFGFHIWFFNQPELNKYGFVKNYFKQKERGQLKKQLTSLYESLSQDEKDFFELYFQRTWVNRETNRDYDIAVLKPMELESKDLNIAYHWLSDKSKSLGLFKGHLVQVLRGGDKEAFESFFPNHINYAAGPDAQHELKGTSEYQPNVKVTITPNKQIDKDWNVPIVLDWIKNYSVKNFTLRTQDNQKDQWPALLLDSKNSSNGFPVIRSDYLSQPIAT